MKIYKSTLNSVGVGCLILAAFMIFFPLVKGVTGALAGTIPAAIVFIILGLLILNHKVLIFTDDYVIYKPNAFSSSIKIMNTEIISFYAPQTGGSFFYLGLRNGTNQRIIYSLINQKYMPEILSLIMEIKKKNKS